MAAGAWRIRPKTGADAGPLFELLDRIQRTEGYPPHRSGPAEEFVTASNELGAWVAEAARRVVGHAALHSYSARTVMELARKASGLEDADLAVPARIFVAPDWRRSGVGRELFDAAVAAAHHLGRRPVLDVKTDFEPAIRLYESAGWSRVGEVVIRFRSPCSPTCRHEGDSINSFVYIGPTASELPTRSARTRRSRAGLPRLGTDMP